MTNCWLLCVISGFRHSENEICALLGFCAAENDIFLATFRDNPLKMGQITCPETSVRKYHSSLHKLAKECRSLCWLVTYYGRFGGACCYRLQDKSLRSSPMFHFAHIMWATLPRKVFVLDHPENIGIKLLRNVCYILAINTAFRPRCF
jgi:hypothetical protein